MNGTEAGDAKTETTGRSLDKQSVNATPAAGNGLIRRAIIAIAGAMLTGGLVAAVLIPGSLARNRQAEPVI